MIAGDVDDARAFSCLAQKLLDHVVAGLRPIPAAFETPAVHDIPDENDRLRLVVPQEIQEKVRLGRFRAQMNIGNEKRPQFPNGILLGCRCRRHASLILV